MYIKDIWSCTYTHGLTQVMYQKKDTVVNAEYINVQLYISIYIQSTYCVHQPFLHWTIDKCKACVNTGNKLVKFMY